MATLGYVRSAIVLASIAVLPLSLVAAAPTLTARLSHDVVREGETVDLLLRYAGGYPSEAPDVSALAKEFEIVGSRHSRRATVVNGLAESSFDWVVTLIPRGVGEVTVPAIRAGNASSLPLTLTVLDGATSTATGEAPDLFVEAEVEDDSPFVQGQVGYTVRVYDAIGMLQGSLSEPEAGGLRIEGASEDRSYETVSNGRPYHVYERRYAMFPQVSGKIVIPPVVLEAVVADRGRSRRSPSPFDDLFADPFAGLGGSLLGQMVNPGRTVRVRSDAVTLDVKPRPEGMDGRWFLPARSVELTESWKPEPPTFRVGEPVTRTVVVRARGAASEQLPALDIPAAPGTRQYDDGSANRTLAAEDGVVSILEQSVAIVPTSPGTVVLPRVEVEWWDVGADEARIASLPERTLEILPSSASAVAVAPASNGDRGAPEIADPGPDDSPSEAPGILNARVPAVGSWIVIIASIVVLAAGALVVPRLRRAEKGPTADRPRSRVRAVRTACAAGRPAEAREALLRWSRARWPEDHPLNLRAIAGKLHATSLAEAIVELDRVLYSRAPSASWSGSALWRAFDAARSRREPVPRSRGLTLPALYPETTCDPGATRAAGASTT